MPQHRPVQPQDLLRICSFVQSAEELFFLFPRACHPLTPTQLQQAIDSRSDSTVLLLDDQVVAFANFYRAARQDLCAIGNVVVDPAQRGRGIGRKLIATMLDLAWQRYQAREVHIGCFNHNTAGLLLYPQLGFQPFAIEQRQDWRGERVALIHMRRQTG